ncbi:hypothetical protein [Helicobacter cappadocius]|uniref:Doubled CXXCH motif domain-containing protein n=1 Tax=Helicobacter cappadocius TaxID=3063998 RepID=A0AA90Q331_9HELI|nr:MULTISPECIES: hypothetical protein [unclassified Helicobacter]MDO7253322.1 hypothetical protein [Helicobacter sp. faydin-H75]MDP2539248.1 hypothetical protein [Helicobacter sp. faydin-H76]
MGRILFYLFAFIQLSFACSGDCASCHYKLDYKHDSRHSPMLGCKTCHTDEKMAQLNMGDTCGQDCFACHSADKLNNPALQSSHGMIRECISCHQDIEKNSKILDKSIFLKGLDNNFFQTK